MFKKVISYFQLTRQTGEIVTLKFDRILIDDVFKMFQAHLKWYSYYSIIYIFNVTLNTIPTTCCCENQFCKQCEQSRDLLCELVIRMRKQPFDSKYTELNQQNWECFTFCLMICQKGYHFTAFFLCSIWNNLIIHIQLSTKCID